MGKKLDTTQLRRMTVPFDVKSVKAESDGQYAGTFEGYAAGIHNIDRAGDMILPGAFKDDLPRFLNEGVVCWQHDWMTPIGVPLEAREDAYGLFTTSRISKTTQGEDAMTLIRDKVVKKLSIGYRVSDYEWVDRAGLQSYLGKSGLDADKQGDILAQYDEADLYELFLIKKLKLYEYSPVSIPANPNALITDAKGLLTGLTFAEHSKTVLTAVQGLAERAHEICALKQARKTKLNAERRSELDQLTQALKEAFDSLSALLNEPDESSNGEAVKLYAEHLRQQARALGCAV